MFQALEYDAKGTVSSTRVLNGINGEVVLMC